MNLIMMKTMIGKYSNLPESENIEENVNIILPVLPAWQNQILKAKTAEYSAGVPK